MPQRVRKDEYEEWKSSYITEQLFNFFKLEAELHRRVCLELDSNKPFIEIGEEYYRRQFAAQCYDMLGNITYEDVFPEKEEMNESNKED